MLSAQLNVLFQRLEKQEETIKEIARFLVQASYGGGTIFLAAFGEMKAVTAAALDGTEALSFAREWKPESYVTNADRVFILAKKDEGDELAGRLSDAGIPFAMLFATTKESELPDVSLSLGINKDLTSLDDEGQNAVPYALAALYVYYAIKLMIDDMISEESR